MEGDDGLKTVECLRGRLLAERQASKLATEDAQLIGNKLVEIENQIREETKLRKKAEKKLKFLRKKLEPLKKISPILEESEKPRLYENSEVSCRSSACSSVPKDLQELELKSQITIPEIPLNLDQNALVPTTFPAEENSNSSGSPNSHENSRNKGSPSTEDPKTCEQSSSSLYDPIVEMEMSRGNDNDHNYYKVDNSLAMVPVSFPATSKPVQPKISRNNSAGEVLDALRHARETLQSSMQTRHMIC